jgi:hypothetical protein
MAADGGFDGEDFEQSQIDDSPEVRSLRQRLHELREEHRALDSAIAALIDQVGADGIQVARLKKRKLALKDQVAWIEDQLRPDIIA